mgnify:CR=1 FL=1
MANKIKHNYFISWVYCTVGDNTSYFANGVMESEHDADNNFSQFLHHATKNAAKQLREDSNTEISSLIILFFKEVKKC